MLETWRQHGSQGKDLGDCHLVNVEARETLPRGGYVISTGEKGQWRHTPGELRDKGNLAAPGLSYNTRAETRKIILKTKAASPSEKNLVLTKCVNSIFFL